MTQTATILDGFYTVVFAGGHRTFRIETQPGDATFAPGKQIIAFLGKDVEFVSFGFLNGRFVNPWKRFQDGYQIVLSAARFLVNGDMQASGKMYALRSGRCWRCNRTLTTPESIQAGIGPYCASQL